MANVVLVGYAGYPYTPSSLCPDNGLGILAAVLQQAGHHVRVLDFGTVDTMRRLYPEELSAKVGPLLMQMAGLRGQPPPPELVRALGEADAELEQHQARETQGIAEEVAREVADIEPAFVGFKLWNGDGFTGSMAIAEAIRRRTPGVKLFAGGPHATWCGPVIYERTGVFDAIAVGEAERTILDLAAHALRGKPLEGIGGIITAAGGDATPVGGVEMDDIPTAVYDVDVYPALAGDGKLKLFVLDDSRGCPYCCAFCTHPFESGTRLRTRSAARLVDDMEGIIAAHGTRAFRFSGSSTPGSLMAQVAEEILRRGLDVRYTSFGHFASSAPEHFDVMRKSGLRALFFGLETGSEELLRKSAEKPVDLARVRETVAQAKAAGIFVCCSMIVPMPGETDETLQESLRLLMELRPDAAPVQFPGLLPGTPWFEHPEKYGFEVDRERYLREQLDYKLKLLFPPAFWKPLPYKVNGMTFGEFTQITAQFVARLEADGILTNVPDDNVLMAELAGMGLREFRDAARLWCATGDAASMARFVAAHNAGAAA